MKQDLYNVYINNKGHLCKISKRGKAMKKEYNKNHLINELKLIFKRRYGHMEEEKYNDFVEEINKMNIKKLHNIIANMNY